MAPEMMKRVMGRREVRSMRKEWHMGVQSLMTGDRKVMSGDVLDRIVKGDDAKGYQKG